jgi:hypothetical protein
MRMHLAPGLGERGIRDALRPFQPAGEREIDDRKRNLHVNGISGKE